MAAGELERASGREERWKCGDREERVPGIEGVRLPECFWRPDEFGCRGGVEFGFVSTSRRREVAVQYLREPQGQPKIFEIGVGQVDRGASLEMLSQYPAEAEVLFPPLSNLEVVAAPRYEAACGGTVVVIPVRINANSHSRTLELLRARRKMLVLDVLRHVINEVDRDCKLAARGCDCAEAAASSVQVVGECEAVYARYEEIDPEELNASEQRYKEAIVEVVEMGQWARLKQRVLIEAMTQAQQAKALDASGASTSAEEEDVAPVAALLVAQGWSAEHAFRWFSAGQTRITLEAMQSGFATVSMALRERRERSQQRPTDASAAHRVAPETSNMRVRALRGSSGSCVDNVQFWYEGGGWRRFGNVGGVRNAKLELWEGEYLTEVRWRRHAEARYFGHELTFVTSEAREHTVKPYLERRAEDPKSQMPSRRVEAAQCFAAPPGHAIVGLQVQQTRAGATVLEGVQLGPTFSDHALDTLLSLLPSRSSAFTPSAAAALHTRLAGADVDAAVDLDAWQRAMASAVATAQQQQRVLQATSHLREVESSALAEFGQEAVVLRLRSGLRSFPWGKILRRQAPHVNVPPGCSAMQLELIWHALQLVHGSIARVSLGTLVLHSPFITDAHMPYIPGDVDVDIGQYYESHHVQLDLCGKLCQPGALATVRPSLLAMAATLGHLCLRQNELGRHLDTLQLLAESMAPLSSLRELDLSNNHIDSVGAAVLRPALVRLSRLVGLNVTGNPLGDGGCTHLAGALTAMRELVILALPAVSMGEAGATSMGGALPALASCRVLNASFNLAVGPVGAAALVDGIAGLSSLQFLDMEHLWHWGALPQATASSVLRQLGGVSSLQELRFADFPPAAAPDMVRCLSRLSRLRSVSFYAALSAAHVEAVHHAVPPGCEVDLRPPRNATP